MLERTGISRLRIRKFHPRNAHRGAADSILENIPVAQRVGDYLVFDGDVSLVSSEQRRHRLANAVQQAALLGGGSVKIRNTLPDGVAQFRVREPRDIVEKDRHARRIFQMEYETQPVDSCVIFVVDLFKKPEVPQPVSDQLELVLGHQVAVFQPRFSNNLRLRDMASLRAYALQDRTPRRSLCARWARQRAEHQQSDRGCLQIYPHPMAILQ